MKEILGLIFITIIFINVIFLLFGTDVRKIKIFKISWIIATVIFGILLGFKLESSMFQYLILSIISLSFDLGMKFSLFGYCFPSQKTLGTEKNIKYKISFSNVFTFLIMLMFVMMTFGITKHLSFGNIF